MAGRIDEAFDKAQGALEDALAELRATATEALGKVGAKIEAISAKVDEIQALWEERQPEEPPPA